MQNTKHETQHMKKPIKAMQCYTQNTTKQKLKKIKRHHYTKQQTQKNHEAQPNANKT